MNYLMAFILTITSSIIFAPDANAAAFFRAIRDRFAQPTEPTPTPNPPPTPTPNPPPTPTPNPPPVSGNFDVFNDVAYEIGDSVDRYYSNYRQLLPERSPADAHRVDSCHSELDGRGSFADRIAFFVHEHTKTSRAHLAHLSSYFAVPSQLSSHTMTSIASHPMCNVTAASLTHTIGANRVPSSSVIQKVNQFTNRYNQYREGMLRGNKEAELNMNKLWTRFMSCLAYTESLTTADTNTSKNAAAKYAPSGYRKPAGVKFYEDPYQNEASRLNIGLFQFTPTASGNVNPCLRHWNEQNPKCQVATNSSRAELIRVFGSSYQTFNAYCGVNKIQQTFAIQVNTSAKKSTHPDNASGSGLKLPQNRCVTPFFYSGWAYNHYGPLQNSTGKNLDSLLTCALR